MIDFDQPGAYRSGRVCATKLGQFFSPQAVPSRLGCGGRAAVQLLPAAWFRFFFRKTVLWEFLCVNCHFFQTCDGLERTHTAYTANTTLLETTPPTPSPNKPSSEAPQFSQGQRSPQCRRPASRAKSLRRTK